MNPKVVTSRSITAAAWQQIEEQLQFKSVRLSPTAMAKLDSILHERLLDRMSEAEAELVDLPTVLCAMQEQNAQFQSFMINLRERVSLEVAGDTHFLPGKSSGIQTHREGQRT